MEAVELNLPSTKITETDKEYQISICSWYEKLASFCEKELIPEWVDINGESPDKWPFY